MRMITLALVLSTWTLGDCRPKDSRISDKIYLISQRVPDEFFDDDSSFTFLINKSGVNVGKGEVSELESSEKDEAQIKLELYDPIGLTGRARSYSEQKGPVLSPPIVPQEEVFGLVRLIFGGRFPPRIEKLVERIQSYFSTYTYPNNEVPVSPDPVDDTPVTVPVSEAAVTTEIDITTPTEVNVIKVTDEELVTISVDENEQNTQPNETQQLEETTIEGVRTEEPELELQSTTTSPIHDTKNGTEQTVLEDHNKTTDQHSTVSKSVSEATETEKWTEGYLA